MTFFSVPFRQSFSNHSIAGLNDNRNISICRKKGWLAATVFCLLAGCTAEPPDYRAQVTADVYEGGDSGKGKQLYEEHCEQCHTLTAGSNKKGPQLLGIYMAPAAELEDYNYSDAMDKVDWTWDAKTLDRYIADAEVALPDTRMLSDPITNAEDRQDIIAYLSTLGREAPPVAKEK